jgi:hypothetical protein
MDLMEKMEFLVHLAPLVHKDYAVNKVKLDCEVLWAQRGRLEQVERAAQRGRLEQVEI